MLRLFISLIARIRILGVTVVDLEALILGLGLGLDPKMGRVMEMKTVTRTLLCRDGVLV